MSKQEKERKRDFESHSLRESGLWIILLSYIVRPRFYYALLKEYNMHCHYQAE